MKYGIMKRILSLVLCISMLIPMLTQAMPVFSVAATSKEPINLEANIGKQAIFDWWTDFLLIDQDTLMNSTGTEMSDYYGNSEVGYENWVLYDDIPANDLILRITDYHYDEENGYHWYKVTGDNLPEILQEKPWILYSDDIGLEDGYDPYLVIYDKNDVIRIIDASVNNFTNVRFVLSGPYALADATISITDHNDDYSVSSLSFVHEENGSWSNALNVEITKANGDPWTSADGNVGILYTAEQIATDIYEEDLLYGAAFLYVDEVVCSATVTDKMGYDVSDIVYTNFGSSVIVFEILLESFESLANTAYFTNESVTLYDNRFGAKDYLAAQLPAEFTAGYSFVYNNEIYYWLENDGFIGSSYFIVKASDVTLGELPEEYGEGRVTITDEAGNALTEITLPIYKKSELTAVSSLSLVTADVKYQWQIEYEEGKWVDIYGEDEKMLDLSFSIVATLLNDNNEVNIRCATKSAVFTAYSSAIPITIDYFYEHETHVEISESFVSSTGETVTVTVAGDIPEGASVALEETDSEGVNVAYGESVVSSLDISINNADGTEWQPESGETVNISLDASKLGLANGDEVVIYHLHGDEVEILGKYVIVNGLLEFEVGGFSKFVVALVEEEYNFDDCIGLYATFNAYNEWIGGGLFDYFWLKSDPTENEENTYEWSIYDEDFEIEQVVKIVGYYVDSEGGLWFRVEPVNGLELPASLKARPWIHMNNVEQYDEDYDALYMFEPEDISKEDMVVLDKYGLSVWNLYLYSDEMKEITVQTNLTGEVKYRWEVCYDTTDYLWTAISGETSPTLKLTYAKLSGVLQDNEWAAIRCVASNAAESVTSNVIIANVLTVQAATYSAQQQEQVIIVSASPELAALFTQDSAAPAAYSVDPAAYGVAPIAEDESSMPTSVLVTVQFVIGDNTNPIENGLFTYNVPYNGSVSDNVTIPIVQGYAAYPEDDRDNPITGIYALNMSGVIEPITITFRFWPAEVSYKVVYMQQNILDDGYTIVKTNELTGLTGSEPVVENVYYDGFVQVWCDTDVIASDGSTVIEVKYDRLYFKMLFDLDGGYGVLPVYARYGTPVSVINPTKAGYIFMGWNAMNGPKTDNNDTTVDIPVFTDIAIPAMHTNYKALWQSSDTAKVTVIIWGQNADDDEYSYMADASKDLSFNAKPGTTVTYSPNGGYICGYTEEHTHGTYCSAICGDEEHKHTIDGGCYQLTCTTEEHTVHTDACYNCGGLDNHTIACYSATYNCTISSTPEQDSGRLTQLNGSNVTITYGGLYRIGENKRYYYFKFGDSFYQVTGNNVNKYTSVTKNCDCDHWEHDDTCELICTVHEHTIEDCYTLTCDETVHTHVASCYSCGKVEHTHGAGCTLTINSMDSNLWTFSHADTVTVAADGSTTLNVYFDRTEFTLTFNYDYSRSGGYSKTDTITARWGENIADEFIEITDSAGSSFWAVSNGGSTYVNYIGIMPQYDDEFWNRGATGSNGTMTYYGQKLEGQWEVMFTVSGVGGYNVTKEDYYEFEGFTYDHGTSTGSDCEGATFYYTRNSYNLVFNTYGTNEKTESVLYEASLSSYGSYVLPDSLAPDVYQPGSVTFKGWYLAPQTQGDFNFENATPFDFANSKMPAGDMILYAWWQPVSHTVTFYYDYNSLKAGTIYTENGEEKQFGVPHGSKIQNPYTPPKDPTSSYYSFVGWAYKTADGTEVLWDFDNSTVTEDVNLYGKWNSTTPADYEVKFVTIINGIEVPIADPITGSALGGSTKTFDAKVNEDLYEGYQDRYYPRVMSHTITINLEDTSKNTFTFYYDYAEFTSYTVKYLEKETGKPISEINSAYPSQKTVKNNTHAMVTETFVAIPGYLPDAYQKVCYIDPDGTNEIIFYYTKDDKNGLWTVHYWLENLDGTYTEAVDMLFTGTAAIGSTVTAPTDKVIQNYYYYAAHTGNVSTGTVSINDIVHLHMYYNRTVNDYTVKYLEAGTNKVLASEKVVKDLKWGTLITENALYIANYQVYGLATKSFEISVDDTKNVITFYYKEKRVTIHYEVVGPDGCGTVIPNSESLAIISGVASGSVANPSSNVYKFVGWYSDADCTNQLITDATYVPTKADNAFWIDGTTYYAKFEYNLTSLTIQKQGYDSIDENQTFLFIITDEEGFELTVTVHGNGSVTIDGLTVGKKYKIVEISEWSWRYTNDGVVENATTVMITETLVANGAEFTLNLTGNVITFTNKRSNPYWLNGDSWCNNIFK